ncbi:histidinol-phosphate transaminase [Sulfolobus sp. S-194]|uniref:histidinol-phosphate transaminase n=1 Tax=Sulfolobus sp. S-194 TaxID=2512240 RepID=UPI002570B24F|nr:histidinol-phosphate transaminase [Sulfolobus sp. S-194]
MYPWLIEAEEYSFEDINEGIRLHLNESPFPPPDFLIEEIKKYLHLGNRYQHPSLLERLRELMAEYNKVEPKNIYPTPGGDGALRAVFYNLIQTGDKVVINNPSYSMYKVYASVRGLKLTRVNLIENGNWWKMNFEKFLDEAKDARLVVIDDPNNPTGSPMLKSEEDKIRNLVETVKGFVLIDEAYYEFSGYTVAKLVNKYPNLLIVRTLSKAFSLASYRVGYLIGNEEVIKNLMKGATPFDISLPGYIAGITALENPSYVRKVVEVITRNREYLIEGLRKLGLKVYNSLTNFVFVKDERDLLSPLLNKGVAIRKPTIGYFRISVGTKEQIDTLLKYLGEIIENSNSK